MSKYTSYYNIFDTKTDKMYSLSTRYSRNCTCILEVDGEKFTSAGGGGYDKEGQCIGEWLAATFPERLKALDSSKNYGLKYYRKTKKSFKCINRIPPSKRDNKDYWASIDGSCGVNSMLTICKSLKLRINEVY